MRAMMMAGLAFLLSTTAYAQSSGAPAPYANQTYDIPAGSKDQSVLILTRDFKPGESSGPHIHHGVEMAEVISGTVEISRTGQKPEIVRAGGSFVIARETPHDARNVGPDVARLAVTLVIDKGSTPRTPVDAALLK